MDDVYPYLRAVKIISNFVGDIAIAWSVLLAMNTLATSEGVPYVWVTVALAFPFLVSLAVKATGDMFGIIGDLMEQRALRVPEVDSLSESMRDISQEVRSRQSKFGAPPSYLDAAT